MKARSPAFLSFSAAVLISLLGCNLFFLTRSKAKDIIRQSFESQAFKTGQPYTALFDIGKLASSDGWETENFDAWRYSPPSKFEENDTISFDNLCVLQRLVEAGWVTETVVESSKRQTPKREQRMQGLPASSGSPASPAARVYRYAAAPKLLQMEQDGKVAIGTIHLGDVLAIHPDTQVLFRYLPKLSFIFPSYLPMGMPYVGEHANYKPTGVVYSWRLEFNELGRTISGQQALQMEDMAQFQKRPSGPWECITERWQLAQMHGSMDLNL